MKMRSVPHVHQHTPQPHLQLPPQDTHRRCTICCKPTKRAAGPGKEVKVFQQGGNLEAVLLRIGLRQINTPMHQSFILPVCLLSPHITTMIKSIFANVVPSTLRVALLQSRMEISHKTARISAAIFLLICVLRVCSPLRLSSFRRAATLDSPSTLVVALVGVSTPGTAGHCTKCTLSFSLYISSQLSFSPILCHTYSTLPQDNTNSQNGSSASCSPAAPKARHRTKCRRSS